MKKVKAGALVKIASLLAATVSLSTLSQAGTLTVSPINIEVIAPSETSSVSLSNGGTGVLNIQARVFKWVQENGKERLEPTKDVVASPPAMRIKQGGSATVRIVRLIKSPAATEESYRLLVDEIPPPPSSGTESVAFAVRHSIPVFFAKGGLASKLNWTAKLAKGVLTISASNAGERRVRLAQLSVVGSSGKVSVNDGLAGYVLGGGYNSWGLRTKSFAVGSMIHITAEGNDGPVDATVKVQPGA